MTSDGRPPCQLIASVVIAALNAQETIIEQLDALEAQDVGGRLQVVVADNGSAIVPSRSPEPRSGRWGRLGLTAWSARWRPAVRREWFRDVGHSIGRLVASARLHTWYP